MPIYKDEARNTYYVICYYTTWSGERKQKCKRGFRYRREAVAWENDFLHKSSGDMSMTLEDFVEVYFSDKSSKLKQRSVDSKKRMINTHILPYFGKRGMNEIKPTDIISWQNTIIDKGYSDAYLRSIQNQMTALFNHAQKFYDLRANPLKKVEKMGTFKSHEMQFWTLEQYEIFRRDIKDGNIMYQLFFDILYWTGCRAGEALALSAADINVVEKTISITKTYHRSGREDVITAPKTQQSNRVVTIPAFLNDECKDYMSRIYALQSNMRLFPVTIRAVEKQLKNRTEKLGLPKIRVHDLRHSHVAYLIEQGVQPIVIAKRVGHESVQTTMNTYGHLYPNKQREIADMLDKAKSNRELYG